MGIVQSFSGWSPQQQRKTGEKFTSAPFHCIAKQMFSIQFLTIVLLIFALLFFISVTNGENQESEVYTIYGTVRFRNRVNDSSEIDPALLRLARNDATIHLCGTGIRFTALLQENDLFVFYDVPPGSYLLEVSSSYFTFAPLKVDVGKKTKGKIRVRTFDLEDVTSLPYPPVIQSLGKTNFFEERQGWSILRNVLFSPMVLMLAMTLGMMWFIKNMDPSALKELNPNAVREEVKPETVLPSFFDH